MPDQLGYSIRPCLVALIVIQGYIHGIAITTIYKITHSFTLRGKNDFGNLFYEAIVECSSNYVYDSKTKK